jgi:hypothetical protein
MMIGQSSSMIRRISMDKRIRIVSLTLLLSVPLGQVYAQNDTHAGQAVTNAAQASGHASASAAHGIAASGQVTSAVSAVPLSIGGAVLGSTGAASAAAARDSMRAATAPIGTPLQVTDEVISVIPPNEALKAKSKSVNQ